MPTRRSKLKPLVVAAIAASIAMALLPESAAVWLRSAIRDGLRPGQELVVSVAQSIDDRVLSSHAATTEDTGRVKELELALRQEQLRNAELVVEMERMKRVGSSPYDTSDHEPLLIPEMIGARVIGREGTESNQLRFTINSGKYDEVDSDSIVLQLDRPTVDQGADSQIDVGQPVYSGRSIVGRVTEVGRWTSVIQPVTDRAYSARAQLMRQTSTGVVFGAEGIIEGDGSLTCRLTGIPPTEAVAIGDDVFSGGSSSRLPDRMFFGRIHSAELIDGRVWEIRVTPAVTLNDVDSVAVLRTSLNPLRVLGH